MEAAHGRLLEVYGGINTGKARPSLLDGVRVEYHRSLTPLNHLAVVSTADRALVIQPFDPGSVGDIEKAIRKSGLGLSTVPAKGSILVPIPPLSMERREELARFAAKVAEEQRIAVRNVRRDVNKALGDLQAPEDEIRKGRDSLDVLTQSFLGKIESSLKEKQTELTATDPRWNDQGAGKKRRKDRPDAPWNRPQDHHGSCF